MKKLLFAAVLTTLTIGPLAFAEDREKREDDEVVVTAPRVLSYPTDGGMGYFVTAPPRIDVEFSATECAAAVAAAQAVASQRCATIKSAKAQAVCMASVGAAAAAGAAENCIK